METALPWSHYSNDTGPRDAAELLDEAVTSIRNRGHTREHALHLVAREFGLRIRRARAVLYGEPVLLLDEELIQIRAAYLRHLAADAENLAARSAAAFERLRRVQEGKR